MPFTYLHKSHEINLTNIKILQQSEEVSNHYLVSCILHIADYNCITTHFRQGRTIIPATKDRFTDNLPDLSHILKAPVNTHELDKETNTMSSIFSNTFAPIKLKKAQDKSLKSWYNSTTHTLKREAC